MSLGASTGSGKTTFECDVCKKEVSRQKRCLHLKECPSCKGLVLQYTPAQRDPAGNGNMAWLCLWCPAIICEWCFWKHTQETHPP